MAKKMKKIKQIAAKTKKVGAKIKKTMKKDKVKKVMKEFKKCKLHSGSKKGPKVTNKKQAVSIALSEAKRMGKRKKKSY